MRRHVRIKLLTEAAYDTWGTVTLPYYAEDKAQRISKVRGQTFVVNEQGNVERHKLGKDAIFKEKLDGSYEQIRFTLPALAPGVVIEYSYIFDSNNPTFLPSWQFQRSEPTLYSYYEVQVPAIFTYVFVFSGQHPLVINETEEVTRPRINDVRSRWAMTDIPALRTEPFMTTPKDFQARLEIQLESYMTRTGTVQFMSSWPEVAKSLRKDNRAFRDPSGPVRAAAIEATYGLSDPIEKLHAIYDLVRTTLDWDGTFSAYPVSDLSKVRNKRTGDIADINMLLVSMLRAVNLEANPMLISTRDHGRVYRQYPMLSQFNALIAIVTIDSQTYFLDATDPMRPYDMLPARAVTYEGWVVGTNSHAWVPIENKARYGHQVVLDLALDETGTVQGEAEAIDSGYSGLNKRHTLEDVDTEEFVQTTLLGDLSEGELFAHEVRNMDEVGERLETSATFAAPGYAQVAGDRIYLNPKMLDRTEENPLRLNERTFPVDMTYRRAYSYRLDLKLPEGYEVEEQPANKRLRLPGKGGSYMRALEIKDGVLTMITQLTFSKARYEPREYRDLRQFYDEVVAAEAEVVVLRKAEEVAGGE